MWRRLVPYSSQPLFILVLLHLSNPSVCNGITNVENRLILLFRNNLSSPLLFFTFFDISKCIVNKRCGWLLTTVENIELIRKRFLW
jgi:hypothetical protein